MIDQTLWDKCVAFHGHRCPGLAIGVKAAAIALDFFMDDITDEDHPGITCTSSTSKCPSDGIRCVLGIDDGTGLTVAEKEGELCFDFARGGKAHYPDHAPGETRSQRRGEHRQDPHGQGSGYIRYQNEILIYSADHFTDKAVSYGRLIILLTLRLIIFFILL